MIKPPIIRISLRLHYQSQKTMRKRKKEKRKIKTNKQTKDGEPKSHAKNVVVARRAVIHRVTSKEDPPTRDNLVKEIPFLGGTRHGYFCSVFFNDIFFFQSTFPRKQAYISLNGLGNQTQKVFLVKFFDDGQCTGTSQGSGSKGYESCGS